MRAELSSIDDRRERRRFAAGCAVASLRSGIGRAVWVTVLTSAVTLAAVTFVSSRASLAGGRGGILASIGLSAMLLLFVVSLLAAVSTRSFRIGLIAGGLALIATLLATLAIWMFEGAHWYHVARVFVADGDPPKGGVLDLRTAILDPLRFALPCLLVWAPWPVLGAAAGAGLTRRKHEEPAPLPTPAMV